MNWKNLVCSVMLLVGITCAEAVNFGFHCFESAW